MRDRLRGVVASCRPAFNRGQSLENSRYHVVLALQLLVQCSGVNRVLTGAYADVPHTPTQGDQIVISNKKTMRHNGAWRDRAHACMILLRARWGHLNFLPVKVRDRNDETLQNVLTWHESVL